MSNTKQDIDQIEQLSEQLHVWYLEATRELDPANYNPKAQKSYAELNEQQKQIDRYIARKVKAACVKATEELKGEVETWKRNFDLAMQKIHDLEWLVYYYEKPHKFEAGNCPSICGKCGRKKELHAMRKENL